MICSEKVHEDKSDRMGPVSHSNLTYMYVTVESRLHRIDIAIG